MSAALIDLKATHGDVDCSVTEESAGTLYKLSVHKARLLSLRIHAPRDVRLGEIAPEADGNLLVELMAGGGTSTQPVHLDDLKKFVQTQIEPKVAAAVLLKAMDAGSRK